MILLVCGPALTSLITLYAREGPALTSIIHPLAREGPPLLLSHHPHAREGPRVNLSHHLYAAERGQPWSPVATGESQTRSVRQTTAPGSPALLSLYPLARGCEESGAAS